MSRKLYLECSSGISGDMMAAALLDLGADREVLDRALASLPVDGFEVKISRVKKAGLDVCDFDVKLDAAHENHDHDMDYLYGNSHGEAEHGHDHDHVHDHGNDHSHGHDHDHEHRGIQEIREILTRADITAQARQTAMRIFDILADAEAAAHGVNREEVHFHEVGAVDSIVDIVTVAVCLDNLGITETIIPSLAEGTGFVRCQHGVIPVPVPAVVNIARMHGLTLSVTNVKGELVTPTGAAIAAAIRTGDRLPASFVIEKTGMGAGKRKYELPGILRAMLIRDSAAGEDRICKLESNIDDCSGETLGYVMDRLFEAGARDVHYTPVYMKKNRPAWQLNVICLPEDCGKLERIIFEETTTIGIRRILMDRTVLKRREIRVQTSLGEARVKVCEAEGLLRYYPEYDSVAELARSQGLSFGQVYETVRTQAAGTETGN